MGRLKDLDLRTVWHPFTQMRDFTPEEDLIMTRGYGNYLYDEEGQRYFDATSSLWVSVHGHNHPALNAAIRRQVGRLAHSTLLGIGNEPSALLARELVGLAPGNLSRVFYSDNGSTAAEVALKMAFQYHRHKGATGTQRSRFVSLANGYHGDTVGSVSVGGMDLFHSIFQPLLFHTYLAPSPNCYRCPFGRQHPGCGTPCVTAMEEILAEKGDEIAAVIVEPMVQGAGGIVIYPAEVLRGYERAARDAGVLFIVDEVATGFGRTGEMFACHHAGVEPDLMAVAKGLTGGYLPVAATLVDERIYQGFLADWKEFHTFFHGHTFTGNPLGCAAALANIEEIRKPGFLERIQRVSRVFREELEDLRARNRFVGDARLLGLMGGLELVANRETGEKLPLEMRAGHHVGLAAREAGVLARPLSDVMVLMPPLSSTEAEVRHLVAALEYGINKALGGQSATLPRVPYAVDETLGANREVRHCRRPAEARRLFVTGTDTGVGKTVVTLALAAALKERGRDVFAYKPVESGVAELAPGESDRARLTAASTVTRPWPTWDFSQPLSPNIAARLDGRSVDVSELAETLRRSASEGAENVLVEGAGGLLVPLTDDFSFADLAREAELPVLVVVGDKLGCLNHTLLTVRTANELGMEVAGVVLHALALIPGEAAQSHNEAELARLLGDLYLGRVPFVADLGDDRALAAAGEAVAAVLWRG